MTKGPQGPFFIFIIQEWTTGQKPKKKSQTNVRLLNFEGAIEANLQRGTLSLRKMGGGNAALRWSLYASCPLFLQCDFIAMQPCILRMTALQVKAI